MAVISKALELHGREETPEENMLETTSPSILHHHTELCFGSRIKYGLESNMP
jgi:hypothetical protein